MDTFLILFISLGFLSYASWILASKRAFTKLISLSSGLMFLFAILILWRVFILNLDFGLVLVIATFFAGVSWLIGYYLFKNEFLSDNLKYESRSYFWILLVILCVRSFAYEPYQIPSRSMEPGLQVGDFVLVNKYAYGIRLPALNIPINQGKDPLRGEIAVFLPPHSLCDVTPEEARPDLTDLSRSLSINFIRRFTAVQKQRCSSMGIKYIKRVIGLPGDSIEMRGFEIWLNGEKVKQEIIEKKAGQGLYEETLSNKIHIIRTQGVSEFSVHKWQIPEGKFLALGDNRDNSLDSRAWGYFSRSNLIGKAEFIWLHWGSFSEIPTFGRNGPIL